MLASLAQAGLVAAPATIPDESQARAVVPVFSVAFSNERFGLIIGRPLCAKASMLPE